MSETVEVVGPYALAFWFGAAFGFYLCTIFTEEG